MTSWNPRQLKVASLFCPSYHRQEQPSSAYYVMLTKGENPGRRTHILLPRCPAQLAWPPRSLHPQKHCRSHGTWLLEDSDQWIHPARQGLPRTRLLGGLPHDGYVGGDGAQWKAVARIGGGDGAQDREVLVSGGEYCWGDRIDIGGWEGDRQLRGEDQWACWEQIWGYLSWNRGWQNDEKDTCWPH